MHNIILNRPIIFLDFETTGLDIDFDRIVEFTTLKVYPDGSNQIKSEILNPGISIPSVATSIHGISNKDVESKPKFIEYAKSLYDFFSDCDIAGYNVKKYDVPLMVNEFKRVDIDFDIDLHTIIDSMIIFHTLEPLERPRDLTAAYKKYCGKELIGAHSSKIDVEATMEILDAQIKHYPQLPNTIEAINKFFNGKQPNWIDEQGKIITSEKGVVFGFGKYRGELISEVIKTDVDYISWILDADFSSEIKQCITQHLNENRAISDESK